MAKAKQGHLPDMEPPSIPAIDEAAENYYDLNDKSWKLRAKVKEAQESLLEAMKAEKLTVYRYEDKLVEVLDKETVKVKKNKEEADY